MKKFSLAFIFALALLVRVLYGVGSPRVIYTSDSLGYYNLGARMIARPSLRTVINPYRTPLYPLFVQAVFYATGAGGSSIGSLQFARGVRAVIWVQIIIGAAAFAIFWQSVRRWLSPRSQLPVYCFLLLDVLTFAWERSLLTEGIGVSLVLVTTGALLSALTSPTKRAFVSLLILFAAGFFLRPALLTVPISSLPVIAWYFRKNKRVLTMTILLFIGFLTIPVVYAQINRIQYGYNGIQTVNDINLLERIIETKTPVDGGKEYPYFYNAVINYEINNGNPHPLQLLKFDDPDVGSTMYRFTMLQQFNQAVIAHTIPLFVENAIRNIPDVLLQIYEFPPVRPGTTNVAATGVWALQQIYGSIQFTTFFVFVLWIFCVSVFLVKPNKSRAVAALLGTVAVGQILLVAATVYHETGANYGRLIAVIRPQMFLFLFLGTLQSIELLRGKNK